MNSRVIKQHQSPGSPGTAPVQQQQFTLNFDPGLLERFSCLRECVATGVYQRGLKRVAIDLDMAPSNLSVQLSEDASRHFSVDSLERYIESTGDTTPIYYLIERHLRDKPQVSPAAVAQLVDLVAQMQPLLRQVGAA